MTAQTELSMTTRRILFQSLACAAAVTLMAGAAHAQGARDAGAEAFVQTQAQRVVSVLGDKSLGRAEKVRTFRGIVDQIADVPKITTFVLGKYARGISPTQYKSFAVVFREYAQNVYETRLGEYHGETVKVTGSVARKPGDVVVTTQVTGGKVDHPLAVSWRVLGGGASWKVVDVQVGGIWLAITQQQDFVSTIDNAGGNIDTLIGQLRTQVQQQQAARAG
jgi:phospholipid transport system substrate-binding protein